MRPATSERHLDNFKRRIASVYRNAIFSRPSMLTLAQEFDRIRMDYPKTLPLWVKESLSNYRMELRDNLINNYTLQMYVLPSGKKVLTRFAWDSFDEESRNFIKNGGNLPIKTFWLSVEEKITPEGVIIVTKTPTDDVYWESSMLNG